MFILTALALLLAGAVVSSILRNHWERIRQWLNNDAANAVEKALGVKARGMLLKAVSITDKAYRMVKGRNVAATISHVINRLENGTYAKTEMLRYDSADELGGNRFIEEIRNASNVMDMEYKQ